MTKQENSYYREEDQGKICFVGCFEIPPLSEFKRIESKLNNHKDNPVIEHHLATQFMKIYNTLKH